MARSLARAARISVSSVMKFDWIQPAREASLARARSFGSASSRNAFACSAVGAFAAAGDLAGYREENEAERRGRGRVFHHEARI